MHALHREERNAFSAVGGEMRPDVCRTPNQLQFKLLLSSPALHRIGAKLLPAETRVVFPSSFVKPRVFRMTHPP